MNYDSFISDIKAGISACVEPEVQLFVQNMPRNNGTSYDGLILLNPDCNVSPTIYLTPYYHRYLEGVSIEDICSDILATYRRHPMKNFDTSLFTDFSKVHSRIVMRLVSYERNETMLAEVPHVLFQDLAIIFYCLLTANDENQASILINHDHLSLWETDRDTLYRLAMHNTPLLLPQQVTPMHTLLKTFPRIDCQEQSKDACYEVRTGSSDEWDPPMYVVSNRYHTNGAAAILYEPLLPQLADQLSSNLILLPSSVHEFILVPVDDCSDMDSFHQMVQEVNETQLTDDEVLADHAYYYDREKRLISM